MTNLFYCRMIEMRKGMYFNALVQRRWAGYEASTEEMGWVRGQYRGDGLGARPVQRRWAGCKASTEEMGWV